GAQMNADMLLAVSTVWDFLHHDYAWSGFQLPRVPSIFPDLLLQFAVALATPNDRWALFAYNVAQFSGFVLVAAYVARELPGASLVRATSAALSVLSTLVLADILLPTGTRITLNYFLSCIHIGPFILSFLGAALACRLLERWSHPVAASFLIMSPLLILSD